MYPQISCFYSMLSSATVILLYTRIVVTKLVHVVLFLLLMLAPKYYVISVCTGSIVTVAPSHTVVATTIPNC